MPQLRALGLMVAVLVISASSALASPITFYYTRTEWIAAAAAAGHAPTTNLNFEGTAGPGQIVTVVTGAPIWTSDGTVVINTDTTNGRTFFQDGAAINGGWGSGDTLSGFTHLGIVGQGGRQFYVGGIDVAGISGRTYGGDFQMTVGATTGNVSPPLLETDLTREFIGFVSTVPVNFFDLSPTFGFVASYDNIAFDGPASTLAMPAVFAPIGTAPTGPGSTPDNPIMPCLTQVLSGGRVRYQICPPPAPDAWIDPPDTYGYEFQMLGDAFFTSILGLPTGFADPFTVWVNGVAIGQYSAGQVVDFNFGAGVSAFSITGINPLVDSSDPTAFPIKLGYSTPTPSFTMTSIPAQSAPVPEPSTMLLLSGGLAITALRGLRRARR